MSLPGVEVLVSEGKLSPCRMQSHLQEAGLKLE